ncbi:hypothetical protein ACW9HQ_43225, partial [Nocardia gipuzkoensis]
ACVMPLLDSVLSHVLVELSTRPGMFTETTMVTELRLSVRTYVATERTLQIGTAVLTEPAASFNSPLAESHVLTDTLILVHAEAHRRTVCRVPAESAVIVGVAFAACLMVGPPVIRPSRIRPLACVMVCADAWGILMWAEPIRRREAGRGHGSEAEPCRSHAILMR